MDLIFYLNFAKAAFKELWHFRYGVLLLGFVIAVAFLVNGFFWKETYVSRATIYADQTNIISPLLQGQASATEVDDQLQVVKDMMLSQNALQLVVTKAGLVAETDTAVVREQGINTLRDTVRIKSQGKNYIAVSYAATDPELAYNVVSLLINEFISVSSKNKLDESRQAFEFIDKQVSAYKEQLQQAEQNLKDFNSANFDGTQDQVLKSIEVVKKEIEDEELNLQQARQRVVSLEKQVANESQYLTKKAQASAQSQRIAESLKRLDELKLTYTDNHPDVIALEDHIEALKNVAQNEASSGQGAAIESVENPVFEELRSALAAAVVEKNTIQTRYFSLKKRLASLEQRFERVIARNAELAELTRDYNVTKGLYEDLLNRKEKARLSMSLDIEGQGVTYKIQEPPLFPKVPSGLTSNSFIILGCLAGLIVPLGLIVAYVFLDPRIRFATQIRAEFDTPLIAEVPHLNSAFAERVRRKDVRLFVFTTIVLAAVYVASVAGFLIVT